MNARFAIHIPVSAVLLGMLFVPLRYASAQSFSDNFNDQSDSQWTEFNPLGVGSYTFPEVSTGDYAYDINAAAQTPLEILASQTPSFAASFYEGLTFTSFYESVDILNWEMNPDDPTEPLDQSDGLLGRMTMGEFGPDGYAMDVSPHSNQLTLSTIVNGSGTIVDTVPVTLNSNDQYLLQFDGVGSTLTGILTDLTDPSQPPTTLQYTDPTYSQGWGGLLVFDNSYVSNDQSTGAGATYDNYFISDVPEPSSLATLGMGLALLGLALADRAAKSSPGRTP